MAKADVKFRYSSFFWWRFCYTGLILYFIVYGIYVLYDVLCSCWFVNSCDKFSLDDNLLDALAMFQERRKSSDFGGDWDCSQNSLLLGDGL